MWLESFKNMRVFVIKLSESFKTCVCTKLQLTGVNSVHLLEYAMVQSLK